MFKIHSFLAAFFFTLVLSACTNNTTQSDSVDRSLLQHWLDKGRSEASAKTQLEGALRAYTDIGMSLEQARPWLENGWERDGAAWAGLGFAYDESVAWVDTFKTAIHPATSFTLDDSAIKSYIAREDWEKFSHNIAKAWLDSGFTPSSAKAWVSNGYGDLTKIAILVANDVRPETVSGSWAEYIRSHRSVDDLQPAIEWMKVGKSPEEAVDFVATIGYTPTDVARWSNTCKKGIESTTVFANTSPYAVKGSCYIFSATLIQAINRSRGLFQTPEGQGLVVSFKNDVVPAKGQWTTYLGIGKNAYQYDSLAGMQTVSELVVLDQERSGK